MGAAFSKHGMIFSVLEKALSAQWPRNEVILLPKSGGSSLTPI